MPHQEPTIERTAGPGAPEHAVADHETAARDPAAQQAAAHAYESDEPVYAGDEEQWLDEPDTEELPRRPRRRLLSSPLPLALLGVLLTACGFIGGALVEKSQTSSSSTAGSGASGLAARFAALRGGLSSAGGAGATGAAPSVGASGGATAAGGFFGRSGGAGGAGATAGQVAYISGNTLYVTTAEGNTVKVTTSKGSTVTKTVKADISGIHPGETVLVTGAAGADGTISAESIRVSGSAGGSGLAALLGVRRRRGRHRAQRHGGERRRRERRRTHAVRQGRLALVLQQILRDFRLRRQLIHLASLPIDHHYRQGRGLAAQ
jgi:hypothetical protein